MERPPQIDDPGPADYLDSMGQVPYFPPTVAGWEGGLSWLNTNTALARFGFIGDVVGNAPNNSPAKVVDIPGETPQAAFDRAFGAVGAPWMSAGTPRKAPCKTTLPSTVTSIEMSSGSKPGIGAATVSRSGVR